MLKYDCHGEGEFILAKSNCTAREVQIATIMSVNRALRVGKSVAMRDEGDTPVVQISIASLSSSLGYDMGDNDGCGKVQLLSMECSATSQTDLDRMTRLS